MSEERQRSWIRPLLKADNYPDLWKLPVSRVWGPVMKGCIPAASADLDKKTLKIVERKGFFYYGASGTGKKRLATAFGASMKKCGYDVLTVRSSMLLRATEEEVAAWVEELVEYTASHEVFFLLENPSRSDNAKLFLDILMEEMEIAGPSMTLVLVVIDQSLTCFRPEWEDMMLPCRFDLPDERERGDYIHSSNTRKIKTSEGNIVEKSVIPFNNEIGRVTLAEHTRDMSYGQLKQVMDLLRLKVKHMAVSDPSINGDPMKMGRAVLQGAFRVELADLDWAVEQAKTGHEEINREQNVSSVDLSQVLAMNSGFVGANANTDSETEINEQRQTQKRGGKGEDRILTVDDLELLFN